MVSMKKLIWTLLYPVRVALSFVFFGIVFLRNRLFDAGFRVKTVSCRVISVGNISVGGTGKTPFVMAYAKHWQEQGYRVAILSRGYGGRRRLDQWCVSDGSALHMSADEAGDEAFLLARELPGVVVLVSSSRYEIASRAIRDFNADICLLDDGFQHRFLKRDEDIVLWHANDELCQQRLMPWGRLREPLSSLRRASQVVISKSHLRGEEECKRLQAQLRRYNDHVSLSREYPHGWTKWPEGDDRPLQWLKGQRCIVFCGLGRPEGFVAMVRDLGVVVCEVVLYEDHHTYSAQDEANLEALLHRHRADHLVCTAKDSVKLSKSFAHIVLDNRLDLVVEKCS